MDATKTVAAYQDELIGAVNAIDPEKLGTALDILLGAYRGDRQVFVFGNGGSAATANHFACDFGKNAVQGSKRRFRILSLADGAATITALANDIAYEEIFRQQLINLMRPGDVAVAISASGNSPNVVRACEYVREMGGKLIVLAGFSGGKIVPMADTALVARMENYERVEDIHLIVLHMIVCWFKEHQHLLA
jgi:D-sedoheptulose 7-phosphate isomerase